VGLNNELTDLRDSALPEWACRPLIEQIFFAAKVLGGEARIVGGAVRDWIAGYPVGDIDVAVNLPIKTVASYFSSGDVRVVETGLQYGTITLCSAGDKIELTQTRVDLETNGRLAVVYFDSDWWRDAARRDFTINAIYLDADGRIFDPLGGQLDLQAGRLKFIGDAKQRVKEDALRIFRYCRFLPRFEKAGTNAEIETLLRDHAALCADLSGERIAEELRQIMIGGRVADVVGLMRRAQIDYSALGIKFNLLPLGVDTNIDKSLWQLGWLAGLATILPVGSARRVARRLRLSRVENRCLARLDLGINDDELEMLKGPKWQQVAYYLGDWAPMLYAVQSWRNLATIDTRRCDELLTWAPPKSPICGADLLSHGVDNGRTIGHLLDVAEKRWVSSNFTLKKAALLKWLFGS
jgi:poly(A) polymerase